MTAATTSGMTSPARRTITVSPTRTSLRSISSWLCSVALVTVTPPTNTGASRATGVSAPVRPDLHLDASSTVVSCFLRRIFVRHRPARLARDKAEFALQIEAVDLVDHAVDVERQLIAARGDVVVEGDQRRRAQPGDALVAHRHAQCCQRIERGAVGQRRILPSLHLAQAIGKKGQRSLRGHRRIELPDAARRTVARIDQGGFAGLALLRVIALEIVAPHVDLATHFQHVGRRVGMQAQRNGVHGADVLA